jgi:hypothetical protein
VTPGLERPAYTGPLTGIVSADAMRAFMGKQVN